LKSRSESRNEAQTCAKIDNAPLLLEIKTTPKYNLSDIAERELAAGVILGMVNYLESEGPLLGDWKDW
jgi:hypothetical protein